MEENAGSPNVPRGRILSGSPSAARFIGGGELDRLTVLKFGRLFGPSGPKRVQGVGDQDTDAQNNEKCCYRLEHGSFPLNGLN
jgi:hypothetical protein